MHYSVCTCALDKVGGAAVAFFRLRHFCLPSTSLGLSFLPWKEPVVAMAEAPDVIEKGLEKLEEEITCPVCQEHFRDPKILPCLHYYCKECVRQLALRAGTRNPFACPECRKQTVLPQNDPDELPTAFFVNRMKELHANIEKAQGKTEAVCEMCSGAKAEAFCRQCTYFICSDCVRSHRKMKVFAGHNVVTLQELKEGGAKEIPLKEGPAQMCKVHDEPLKIFCFDCNHLICRDCIIHDHAGHTFEFVKISAPQYKKTLKESLAPLAKIQTNLSAATREVEKVEREVFEQNKVVAGTIEQSFKKLHEILCKREKQLLDRASELKQQKLDNLEAQKKGFTLATSEIQGLVEFVERSVENATDEEFMLLQQHIQEQIQEQCAKHERINLIPAEVANLGVRVACAEGISDLCQKDAEVIVLPADPTKCTAEGSGTKSAEVGKPAQFTVCTVYQNGQLCREKQVVEAELKSLVYDCVIQPKVTSRGRGVYEITYAPNIRGRHTLIVKVNGTQIAGSPFQVFAKIHPTELGEPVTVVKGVGNPWGLALNNKRQLVVAEHAVKRVTVFDKDGKMVQAITHEKLLHPAGVAVDEDDNIYVTDNGNSSLFKFSKEGKLMKTVGRKGTRPEEFNDPTCIKLFNDRLYVCDRKNHRVQILNTELEYVNSFGGYGDRDGRFNIPNDIAQDGAGNLFVTDANNHRVQVFDCNGQFLYAFSRKDAASKQLNVPVGICIGSDQFVNVCDNRNKCISMFTIHGEFATSYGPINSPFGIVVDNDGFVYVCEYTIGQIIML